MAEVVETVAPRAPVTSERFMSPTLLAAIPHPNVPRALEAVDSEHPHGTPEYQTHGYSVLQQHVMFFDLNNDGIIHPWETFIGFRAIGFNRFISFISMVLIHGTFSYNTLESWIPSPLFPIYIKNIHKDKHGSDTEVYDTEGRFVSEKFEELFSKYSSRGDKTRLTFWELFGMTNSQMNVYDPFGWVAEKFEWLITYLLLRDAEGLVTTRNPVVFHSKGCLKCVSKEHMRGMYDGSLFYTLAKLHQRRQGGTSVLHKFE